ncbi:cation diffusion facilitator family transporter [Salarchaeum sp. JOR-1]|uniref:cation diffusion facilitator family transporter n=1 Tax=Salarchaeum sp. JOR-1 TaxID=2599399 RepID=UPI001198BA4E|nr:cation diffusion facilitator family transporter [Salarchaeum sp. JOR-1]QDX40051.1 cation transporter [Salarchaeum sp. JOR-1]
MSDHGHDHSGHDHDDGTDHASGGANMRGLAIALGINTAFFAVELAGALYADSLTLLADAVHMITDSASIALALFAAWVAARPADEKRTYGYQRAELLGALANGVFLVLVVLYILYDAVQRFQNPQPVKPLVVVAIGVFGLAANLAAAYAIHGGRENLNVKGAYLHLLADAAGSVAAIVLGVALYYTDYHVLDPLFAVLIAALVLYSAKDLLAESVHLLLQGTPGDVDIDAITRHLCSLDGVTDAHDVHVWALSSDEYALSAHVVVTADADRDAVLDACQHDLAHEFGIDHATLQLERPDGSCETADIDCYSAE